MHPQGCVRLNNAKIEKIVKKDEHDKMYKAPEPFGFKIITEFRIFVMCDKDEKYIDKWVDALNRAVKVSAVTNKDASSKVG